MVHIARYGYLCVFQVVSVSRSSVFWLWVFGFAVMQSIGPGAGRALTLVWVWTLNPWYGRNRAGSFAIQVCRRRMWPWDVWDCVWEFQSRVAGLWKKSLARLSTDQEGRKAWWFANCGCNALPPGPIRTYMVPTYMRFSYFWEAVWNHKVSIFFWHGKGQW